MEFTEGQKRRLLVASFGALMACTHTGGGPGGRSWLGVPLAVMLVRRRRAA